MKLLVDHDLAALNAFLASVNVGDYVVSGQVESYSCTHRAMRWRARARAAGGTRERGELARGLNARRGRAFERRTRAKSD